jgi:hypothetical protein
MTMVKALCVDGPRAGAEVWLGASDQRWSRPALWGYLHYEVAGRREASEGDPVVELVFCGRSRTTVPPADGARERG